jgi:hypothetical protein
MFLSDEWSISGFSDQQAATAAVRQQSWQLILNKGCVSTCGHNIALRAYTFAARYQ